MATHCSILLGESRGQWSLGGYSPWGCKESDMTEQLTLFTIVIQKDVCSNMALNCYLFLN